MGDSERLSALIGDIYDTALDPNLWVDVLGRAGRFVGCTTAGLGWKDVAAKRGYAYYTSQNADPYYTQLYFEKYIKMDPCSVGQFFADVGGVPDVVETLGVAETTVKYHLGNVYKKTDRSRQADLVKLVAEFSNRLVRRG